MSSKGKEATQRFLAVIVIVAMLSLMGIPSPVLIFFAVVTYFIWRAVQRSEHQETGRIFEFYIHANEVLRDEERRWYGFEIAEVIERGERVMHSMSDPPPLVYFALGALYNYAGDHEAAIEHLAYVAENETSDERRRFTPSPELRRYVQILRKLEREPAEAPQTMAAIRSLDRLRRGRVSFLLADSRERLRANPALNAKPTPVQVTERTSSFKDNSMGASAAQPPSTPPPISEVLRDVWSEEKKTA